MKYILFPFILFFSCTSPSNHFKSFRKNFSSEELKIITQSKEIIQNAYFGTFITIDKKGQPRARVMEPFAPTKDFIIWLATNPKSRKVHQISNNSKVTMHYFDKTNLGYVSLMGTATLVNDEAIKAAKFKDGWDKFYPNQKEDYLLIKFVPEILELISIPNGFTGDSLDWKPHGVVLRTSNDVISNDSKY